MLGYRLGQPNVITVIGLEIVGGVDWGLMETEKPAKFQSQSKSKAGKETVWSQKRVEE